MQDVSVAALGIPGLILVVAMGATGYVGAAALTTALASLGPGGMIGGIAILGVVALISKGISQYGFQAIFIGVVSKLKERGETTDSIFIKIEKYDKTRYFLSIMIYIFLNFPRKTSSSFC